MTEEEKQREQGLPDTGAEGGGGPAAPGSKRDDVAQNALSDALNISFRFLKIGMLILIVVYLMQGWFYVPRDRVAIKLSFGRPVEVNLRGGRGRGFVIDSESGWHFGWPWQEIVWLPIEQQTLELDTDFSRGGRAAERGERAGSEDGRMSLQRDNYLITGDVNIIHMSLRARYRIPGNDPETVFDYAFRFESPEEVFRRLIVKAATEVVSNWEVLEVRRKRRVVVEGRPPLSLFEEIERRTREYMRDFKEKNGFSVGVELVTIEPIEDPEVPDEVRDEFDRALAAESEKEAMIERARREETRIVQAARGAKAEIVASAQARKTHLVTSAEADAEMLKELNEIYHRSPELAAILKEWHYGRTIDELLGMAQGAFVLHGDSRTRGRELWLELAPQR